MRLVCCLVLVLGGLQLASALKVAAWNVQNFGGKKANLPGVLAKALKRNPTPQEMQKADSILEYIATVVRLYDVIVIQELQDTCAKPPVINATTKDDHVTVLPVVNKLMDLLNPAQTQPDGKKRRVEVYKHIVSYPLGPCTNNHRERYLFIYKIATVTALDSSNYVVPGVNPFSRPPFSVKFQARAAVPFDFVLVPLHAIPGSGKTYKEINALDGVVKNLPASWFPASTKNILLLGDFNAGGAYLTKRDKDLITLLRCPDYHWLIYDSVLTNVANTFPYDRIVATTGMLSHLARRPSSDYAGVYDFVRAGNLPPGVQAKEISDHFPVEVELQ